MCVVTWFVWFVVFVVFGGVRFGLCCCCFVLFQFVFCVWCGGFDVVLFGVCGLVCLVWFGVACVGLICDVVVDVARCRDCIVVA